MVAVNDLVNQRLLVAMYLAGGFITNLNVLINLVMWQLPKKETRKSCVTKVKVRRSCTAPGMTKLLPGGGSGQGSGGQPRTLPTCPGCLWHGWVLWSHRRKASPAGAVVAPCAGRRGAGSRHPVPMQPAPSLPSLWLFAAGGRRC